MSEFQGTGGEWLLAYDEDSGTFTLWMGDAVVERHTGAYPTVGEIELYSGWWPEQLEFAEVEANCRLLAASRDLLHACNHSVKVIEELEAELSKYRPGSYCGANKPKALGEQ